MSSYSNSLGNEMSHARGWLLHNKGEIYYNRHGEAIMLIKEVYYYFSNNKIRVLVLICQISILFVLMGTFNAFSREIYQDKDTVAKLYEDKAIYQLLDGYYEQDKFNSFIEKENSLTLLKNFYNELCVAKNFNYLAMFNQPIMIKDFSNKLSEIPINSHPFYNGEPWKELPSFQINQHAHEYFNISVSFGRVFNEADFENKRNLPVLIGSNYADIFNVGDQIEAQFYSIDVVLEVVGIIQKDTFVYFNGEPEFYLDNYVIIPYINYGNPHSEHEEWFQKIVYFAMINGYIFVDIGREFSNNMMIELESISQNVGFYNYSFIGSNPHVQPYRGLLNVISSNYMLVQIFFACSFFLNIATICFQLFLILKKRLANLAIHYLFGATLASLIRLLISEILIIIMISYLISTVILKSFLSILDVISSFRLLTIVLLSTICITLPLIFQFKKMDLVKILNKESNLS